MGNSNSCKIVLQGKILNTSDSKISNLKDIVKTHKYGQNFDRELVDWQFQLMKDLDILIDGGGVRTLLDLSISGKNKFTLTVQASISENLTCNDIMNPANKILREKGPIYIKDKNNTKIAYIDSIQSVDKMREVKRSYPVKNSKQSQQKIPQKSQQKIPQKVPQKPSSGNFSGKKFSSGSLGQMARKPSFKVGNFKKSDYIKCKHVGEGAYGEISLCRRKSDDKKIVIKKFEKESDFVSKIGLLPKEYVIMKRLKHPNIAEVYDLKEDKYYFYMTMKQYYKSLAEFMDDYDYLDTEPAIKLFENMVNGVEYCHKNGVIHRDIKLENIMLESENSLKIVLIDFGFSSVQPIDQLLCDYPGSPVYAAPELLNGEPYLGTKSDIWALGISLYTMVTGEYPFFNSNRREMFNQVTKEKTQLEKYPSQYPHVDDNVAKLISRMLQKNPKDRPTIKEIKKEIHFIRQKFKKVPQKKKQITPQKTPRRSQRLKNKKK